MPGSDLSKPVPDGEDAEGLAPPAGAVSQRGERPKGPGAVTPHEAAARASVMEAIYSGAKSHEWVKPQ